MQFRCQHQDSNQRRCAQPTYADAPYCFWHLAAQRAVEYSRQWPFEWHPQQVGLYFYGLALLVIPSVLLTIWVLNHYSNQLSEAPRWIGWGPVKIETQFLVLKYQMLPLALLIGPMFWAQGSMLRSSIRTFLPKVYFATLLASIVIVPYFFWAPQIFGYAGQLPPFYSQTCWLVGVTVYYAFLLLGQVLNFLLVMRKPPFPHLLLTILLMIPLMGGLGILLLLIVLGLWWDTQYHWITAARKRLDV